MIKIILNCQFENKYKNQMNLELFQRSSYL